MTFDFPPFLVQQLHLCNPIRFRQDWQFAGGNTQELTNDF